MQWLLLVVVAVFSVAAAYLSYLESCRDCWWYVPAGVSLAVPVSIIWYSSARLLGNANSVYFYSMCWDAVAVAAFYLIPLLCFGVRLNWQGLAGVVCMLVGLLLFKAS